MENLKNEQVTLLLLRGLPGTGKTTLANMIVGNNQDNWDNFEADMYMVNANGIYQFDPERLQETHDKCYNNTKKSLLRGKSVIVSNTLTTTKEVERYQELAKECNVRFKSVIIENRNDTESIHNVPTKSMERMEARFAIKLK